MHVHSAVDSPTLVHVDTMFGAGLPPVSFHHSGVDFGESFTTIIMKFLWKINVFRRELISLCWQRPSQPSSQVQTRPCMASSKCQ